MALEKQSKSIINVIPERHKTFKNEVHWGFKELVRFRRGEKVIGADSIYSIVHGQIASKAKLAIEKGEKRFGDFQIFKLDCGTLVAHKDFLAIQNEFGELEAQLAEGKPNIPWDDRSSVHAMELFFKTYQSSRERHEKIFERSLGQLSKNEQKNY